MSTFKSAMQKIQQQINKNNNGLITLLTYPRHWQRQGEGGRTGGGGRNGGGGGVGVV